MKSVRVYNINFNLKVFMNESAPPLFYWISVHKQRNMLNTVVGDRIFWRYAYVMMSIQKWKCKRFEASWEVRIALIFHSPDVTISTGPRY